MQAWQLHNLSATSSMTTTDAGEQSLSRENDERIFDNAFAEVLERSSSSSLPEKERRDYHAMYVPMTCAPLPVLEVQKGETQLSGQSARKLAALIRDAIYRGVRGVEMRLCPEELGKLSLHISLQGNDVHVQAEAENQQVVQLLLSSQGQLAENLAKWGLNLRGFTAYSSRDVTEAKDQLSNAQASVGTEKDSSTASVDNRRSYIEVVA